MESSQSDVEMEDGSQGIPEPNNAGGTGNYELRRKMRSLNKNLEEQQGNPTAFTTEDMNDTLDKANTLFQQVETPQDAALDSRLLVIMSDMNATKAKSMKHDTGGFDADDFVARLITFMGGHQDVDVNPSQPNNSQEMEDEEVGSLEWEKIGRKALAKSRRVPMMSFMLGPLSIEAKVRTVKQRAKLDKKAAEEVKPQELGEGDIQRSENETTKNVAMLEDILATHGVKVNVFRFIVNPESFGQTVENMFYLSFLIRDGKCALEWSEGENPEPVIYTCDPPTEDDYKQDLRKRQLVFELDMATWTRAIEVFNITEPMIPTRPESKQRFGNKWYG
ncbi:hypothetical protein SISSUDRAFT_1057496 [Sistotremastrum suecicum HHB10207 ss-3]|uniref:Non-structural maintenance of chromosomes element 4 n=1 Tax=Sistotremastrum suecicum HHB10207 ss-3 TaxID=1314776 RepID=A0A166I7M4_9AGAM|nr:hypothetical protein SISSUDRAFT_1057496 [Sistotremastrum suecicum HHB10207 ss-3]